ncbi:MAG: hypothetical protein ACXABY_28230 [Candidatus Thorarchaeota archaeon]|jgi:hypothetical protein
MLDTMSATSFNFVAADLEPGVHNIKVQAMIDLNGEASDRVEEGEWEAKAVIGRGTVTVEVVRMINQSELLNWLELEE